MGEPAPSFSVTVSPSRSQTICERVKMINAIYTIEDQWNRGIFFDHQQEFETIGELEHFLAYNRSYITKLSFEGSIQKESN
jgi:hypothetical protein